MNVDAALGREPLPVVEPLAYSVPGGEPSEPVALSMVG
jgi:hypothetical protein